MKVSKRKSTEEHLADSVKQVQMAVLGSDVLHLSHGSTGDPGRYGVVACFVVLPDAEVEELRGKLDAEIARYLEKSGYGFLKNLPPQ